MNDKTIGNAIRQIRIKKGQRQADVAKAARTTQQTVSRIECGNLAGTSVALLRRVVRAIDASIVLDLRWEGAEVDRLLGARHSAMHEAMAALFASLPGWISQPEVSFSVFGERGVIDILAWHAATQSLLVIELKTELADLQAMLGTLDRKIRLAAGIAKERGWAAKSVSAWLVVADGSANRSRIAAHRALLRSALPVDSAAVRTWLRHPSGTVRAMGFLAASGSPRAFAQPRRVSTTRRSRTPAAAEPSQGDRFDRVPHGRRQHRTPVRSAIVDNAVDNRVGPVEMAGASVEEPRPAVDEQARSVDTPRKAQHADFPISCDRCNHRTTTSCGLGLDLHTTCA